MNIVLISGSNAGRKTKVAVDAAEEAFHNNFPDVKTRVFDLKEIDMIFADGRNYLDYGGDMTELAEEIMQADGIVIGMPVYQAGIPAVLKNILDMLPDKALLNKAVSLIITAGSDHHQLVGEYQVKPILSYLKAEVVPSYVFINDKHIIEGELISDDVRFRIADLVMDTALSVKGIQTMLAKEEDILGF